MNRELDMKRKQDQQNNKQTTQQDVQRGVTADKDNLRQHAGQSQQSGQAAGSQQRTAAQAPDAAQQGERGANRLAADEDMDDDSGLSNTANRQSAVDQGSRQASQSNVGRRDDGTPD